METDIVTTPESETTPMISTFGAEGVHEFIRYFAASTVALVVDFGLLWFLTSALGVSYLLSGALSFTVGMIVVYILSVYWVFAKRVVRNSLVEFSVFALIGLIGLALNEVILYLLTSVVGLFYLLSKLCSVVVVFTWNFAARKWLLFSANS